MAIRGQFNSFKLKGITQSNDISAGNAFFVGNSTANSDTVTAVDDINSHGTIQRPFATGNFATNQCVANRGDFVYFLEGHAENITSTASFSPDVAGVTYIALGEGANRATFTGTTTASKTVVTGAGVKISNCVFKAGTTATAVSPTLGFQLANRDITIDKCSFVNGGSSSYCAIQFQITSNSSAGTAAHSCKITGNEFLSVTGNSSGTTIGIKMSNSSGLHAVSQNLQINGNKFNGAYTTACIDSHSSGTVHINMELNNNSFYNSVPAGAAMAVSFRGPLTGIASYNNMTCLASTDIGDDIFDPGSLLCTENYAANTIDESAAITPLTVASSC